MIIAFDFAPKFVWMCCATNNGNLKSYGLLEYNWIHTEHIGTDYSAHQFSLQSNNSSMQIKKSTDGKTLTWYSNVSTTSADLYQMNKSGFTYHWFAIG